jgi:4-hydroxy-tetrahydrodipicolinate reductase
MKLAVIGYGAMGQLVAGLGKAQGHEVSLTLNSNDAERNLEELVISLNGCDAAIDFSIGAAVPKNARLCAMAGVPLVEGTTGWAGELETVTNTIEAHNGALVYGANFSVGVQIFYRIATQAADLFRNLQTYDPFIEEAHHKRKRDAPSGTAIALRDLVVARMGRDIPVASTRAGYIPGTHRLGFDSAADQITITHTARSREGFAAGALLAANWIVGRRGVFEFSAHFDEMMTWLKERA